MNTLTKLPDWVWNINDNYSTYDLRWEAIKKKCQAYRWIEEYEIPQYGFIPDIGGEIKAVFKILEEKRK